MSGQVTRRLTLFFIGEEWVCPVLQKERGNEKMLRCVSHKKVLYFGSSQVMFLILIIILRN
jgi:hypothetical protein